jgi:hypothetical protein
MNERLTMSVHSMTAYILDVQPEFSRTRSKHDPVAFNQALRFAPTPEDKREVIIRASKLALSTVETLGGSAPLVQPPEFVIVPEIASIFQAEQSEAA